MTGDEKEKGKKSFATNYTNDTNYLNTDFTDWANTTGLGPEKAFGLNPGNPPHPLNPRSVLLKAKSRLRFLKLPVREFVYYLEGQLQAVKCTGP